SCYDARRSRSFSSFSSFSLNSSLKFLIALPIPFPSPGSRFAPKITMMIARMTSSSGMPRRPIAVLLEAGIVPLILASLGAAAYAQFTSDVNLVEVYASVTTRHGDPVGGLTARDFRVSEDGLPQTITTFAAGEFPLAVAIGVDRSFSMGADRGSRLDLAKSAARAFIGALTPDDQVMVVAIGSE